MSAFNCGCSCKCNCTFLSIVASVIIGIITAFLSITGVITLTSAFLWVVFGIGVVYLAVVLIACAVSRSTPQCECFCSTLSTLLISAILTAFSAVILLGVTFAAASVVGAIFAGLLLFFLFLTLCETACLVKLLKCDC